ncbi:MAG: hypothetical protein H0X62_02675, partial [Bacteroidetes bacterium]|nr:hypothetical protein [Bacteroidota bacterium]
EYFGTNHNSTDPNDNSGIPLEYFLTAHKIENPYDTGNWLGNPKKSPTSKPHVLPKTLSGVTLGFGLDLGTSGISNFNANDPNADEFTLNRLLLNLTSTWQNFSSEQKHIIYSVTVYGVSNSGNQTFKRYESKDNIVKNIYNNNKSLFDSLDLQNTNGGYTKTLKEFIIFFDRYYLKGANNLSDKEKYGTKFIKSLKLAGLHTEPNTIELFAILSIGINKGKKGFRDNAAANLATAINQHNLLFLATAVNKAYRGNSNTKTKLLTFLKTSNVKTYFFEKHFNLQTEIDKVTDI